MRKGRRAKRRIGISRHSSRRDVVRHSRQTFPADVQAYDVQLTLVLRVSDPRQLIVATAEALGVDLLVIGAHRKRSFLGMLLGGTTTAVSRHAPCAVVMVQPGKRRPLLQTSEVGEALRTTTQGQPA